MLLPYFHLIYREQKHIRFCWFDTSAEAFEPPGFFLSSLIITSTLVWRFGYCFIYLSIHSISIFWEPFSYVAKSVEGVLLICRLTYMIREVLVCIVANMMYCDIVVSESNPRWGFTFILDWYLRKLWISSYLHSYALNSTTFILFQGRIWH